MRRAASCFSTLVLLAVVFTAFPCAAQSSGRLDWLRDRIFGPSSTPANGPEAALARLGGSRLILKADTDDVRAVILRDLRNDVRRLLRDARVPYSGLFVRDGGVEVRTRDIGDLPRALAALAATAGTADERPGGAVDVRDMGDGLITLTPTQSAFNDRLGASLDDAAAIIRRRMKDLGVASAGVERAGADRIRVLLPGVKDPARLAGMMVSRAQLAFRLIDMSISPDEALRSGAPAESEVLYDAKDKGAYLVDKQVLVSGRDMLDAQPGFDQRTRDPIVSFRLTARGTGELARISRDNIGRPFAIVLDNEVISAPVIREPILGGSGQISGGFTVEQANNLAILLRTGALPVGLTAVEQQTVEPAQK